MTAARPNAVRSPVFLEGRLQAHLKAESSLGGAHFYFQDVGVEGSQLLGEGTVESPLVCSVESPLVCTQFSLGTEEVVGQVENNLEELYRCFQEEVGGKRDPFS